MIDDNLDNLDMFGDDEDIDDAKGLVSLTNLRMFRWEGTLRAMLESVRLALRQQQVNAVDIERIAPMVVVQLCSTIGGQVAYLPRGAAVRRALRDARLFDEWRWEAAKPPALATKYRLAVQTVYEIIARQRALVRQHEPDLFGFGVSSGDTS